ncbi:DUF4382 domain-containing protein [Halomarina pelagica]|uniref:DUF4382 domain-containing protein n=1 Tax=Halomarina pelagica TaxID=2961599 RepID=UPI0020C330DC|nr:DUF4382 domain-containing protein [Halomarina sp. BND7]
MRSLSTALLVGLVVLAGCLSGTPLTSGTNGDTDPDDAGSAQMGTVNVYVSDQPNAIEAFSHLNVTITEVGFRTASGDAGSGANVSGNASTNASDDASTNVSDDGNDTASNASANGSARADGEAEADTRGAWRIYDVDDRRVDLTELRGANATLLGNVSVPEGTYTGVYVEVSEVNGTLESGDRVNVKLPSGRLRVHDRFTVGGEGESEVDFVFDMTVFEAGKSGKYVLKPVAEESGADQPFRTMATGETGVRARFVGPVEAGERATVKVTGPGGPVADAAVYVNGEEAGTTGGDGTVSVALPDGQREVEVSVQVSGGGDATATVSLDLAVRFGADGVIGAAADGGDGEGGATANGEESANGEANASAEVGANASVTGGDDGDGGAGDDGDDARADSAVAVGVSANASAEN